MNKQLTIVIPCKNEGRGIIEVLKLIRKQQVDCQVIIADSSDDKYTSTLLQKYQAASPTVLKIVSGGLPSVARNNGAKYVKTPYVLFLDADIYLQNPNVISKCLTVIASGKYDLVTCKFKTLDGKYDWVFKVFNIIQRLSSMSTPFAIGGFMLFSMEKFKAVGGFDEEAKVAEDYLLSSKIKPSRFKIVSETVHTPGRRFEKKGIWYMVKLMLGSWKNKNNPEWFKDDHNYWK